MTRMSDREKVLMGLTCCANLDAWSERVCQKCPYIFAGDGNGGCEDHLIADTFALLKEQDEEIKCLRARVRLNAEFGLQEPPEEV